MKSQEILMVKIHNAIDKDHKTPYDATRGNWVLARKRLPHVKYVLGIYKGTVLCAFEPQEWGTIVENGKERKHFRGEAVAEPLLQKFQAAQIKLIANFGSGEKAYASLSDVV